MNGIMEGLRVRRRTSHIGRALHFVWESGPGWMIADFALAAALAAVPLVSLYLTKLVVDAVVAGASAPDKHAAFRRVALLIGLAAAATLLSAVARSIAALVREAQAQAVTDHMYDVLHAKSAEVDLRYYEDPGYHDTLHRSQREAPVRPTRIVANLMEAGQGAVTLLALAALLCSFHWALVAALLAGGVPGVLARLGHARKAHRAGRERTPTEREAWYYSWLLTGDAHAKELRIFRLGPLFMARFRELRAQLRREMLRLSAGRSAADAVGQACAATAAFGAYAFIAWRTVQGAVTLGGLVMYAQALHRGQESFRRMMGGAAALYEDQLFLSTLYEFLDLEPAVREPAAPRPVPRPMRDGIIFEKVSFGYPGGRRPVLEDVSLTVRPGETVAIVGENGSGKTTLVKLLCRLYDPTSGRITMDGADIRDFSVADFRSAVGVVFQDFARYQMTAGENIRLGDIAVPPDDARIVAAAERAGAGGLIGRLPRGYRTPLGRWFEGGEEISAGEWQRLALGRACLGDSQVLVLDEPTSALDAEAEYELFNDSRRIVGGRAAVIVSHRFSTVRMADRIYVLRGGRIAEQGSPRDLVQAGGYYAQMFKLQQ